MSPVSGESFCGLLALAGKNAAKFKEWLNLGSLMQQGPGRGVTEILGYLCYDTVREVCMCVYVFMCVYVYVCVHVYVCMCVYVCVYVCMCRT